MSRNREAPPAPPILAGSMFPEPLTFQCSFCEAWASGIRQRGDLVWCSHCHQKFEIGSAGCYASKEAGDYKAAGTVKYSEDGSVSFQPIVASVPDLLRAAAETYEQRNPLWGNNYKEAGAVMLALLPRGVELKTADDWTRFGLFMHVMNKVTRYAQNLNRGGNKDSAHDLVVYAAMLEEMTGEQN